MPCNLILAWFRLAKNTTELVVNDALERWLRIRSTFNHWVGLILSIKADGLQ